jgi:hypothetical protein
MYMNARWNSVASVSHTILKAKPQGTCIACRSKAISTHSLLQDAKNLQALLDMQGALTTLEHARLLEPNNAAVLALASKQWTDHTYLPGMLRADIVRCNEKAIELAKRSQLADESFSLAHAAECICKGRLATFERNPKRILTLAKEAQEAAYRAIKCNSDDDIAHHLIGRWHIGMAELNFVVKQFIKYVFGTQFRPGTLEGAREAYETAVRLRPDRLIHKVELARCLVAMQQTEEAMQLLLVCHLRAVCVAVCVRVRVRVCVRVCAMYVMLRKLQFEPLLTSPAVPPRLEAVMDPLHVPAPTQLTLQPGHVGVL